jgi:hypothetical protein
LVSKPYLIFLLVLAGNPNPFGVRGAKKARFCCAMSLSRRGARQDLALNL